MMQRQRLFHEHMLACVERLFDLLIVPCSRSRQNNSVYRLVSKHVREAVSKFNVGVETSLTLQRIGITITNDSQCSQLGKVSHQVFAPVPAAYNRNVRSRRLTLLSGPWPTSVDLCGSYYSIISAHYLLPPKTRFSDSSRRPATSFPDSGFGSKTQRA